MKNNFGFSKLLHYNHDNYCSSVTEFEEKFYGVIGRLFAILSCHSISLVESLNDEKWKNNNFWKVFKFEILNKLLQQTLKKFCKKKWTQKWRISKLMKIMIERENTKRNQSLSKRLKLKEVTEYVKIKKTLLNIMPEKKAENRRQIELRSLSCDRCPLIFIKCFPLPLINRHEL